MPKLAIHHIDQLIGLRIKRERERQGFTLKEVAEEVGISIQMLSHHENGRAKMTIVRLLIICKVLDKPLQFFIEGKRHDKG